jgi:hypothetical protein
MTKKIELQGLLFIAAFSVVFELTVNIVLDLKYHLYGYFKVDTIDIEGFIAVFGLYPAGGMIVANYFPYGKKVKIVLFLLVSSLLSTGYEYLSVKSGYFYHSGWKYWWSLALYPFLILIVIGAVKVFQYVSNKDKVSR